MPEVLKIHDPIPDFDGSLLLTLTDRNGDTLKEVMIHDVEEFNLNLIKTLSPEEKAGGLPFLNAVRRYMQGAHQVKMSVQAASRMYAEIRRIVNRGKLFFQDMQDSADSTDAPPANSASA